MYVVKMKTLVQHVKSMWNTAVGIKNCKQLFSLRVAFMTQKNTTRAAEMMSVERVAIFWVVNASSGEKSCLQFSILEAGGARLRQSCSLTTVKSIVVLACSWACLCDQQNR